GDPAAPAGPRAACAPRARGPHTSDRSPPGAAARARERFGDGDPFALRAERGRARGSARGRLGARARPRTDALGGCATAAAHGGADREADRSLVAARAGAVGG